MIKMLEDIITKNNERDSDVVKKPSDVDDLPFLIKRNLKSLLRYCDAHDISKSELIKIIKSE